MCIQLGILQVPSARTASGQCPKLCMVVPYFQSSPWGWAALRQPPLVQVLEVAAMASAASSRPLPHFPSFSAGLAHGRPRSRGDLDRTSTSPQPNLSAASTTLSAHYSYSLLLLCAGLTSINDVAVAVASCCEAIHI